MLCISYGFVTQLLCKTDLKLLHVYQFKWSRKFDVQIFKTLKLNSIKKKKYSLYLKGLSIRA